MVKQKFRPARLCGFSGMKTYIPYDKVLKKRYTWPQARWFACFETCGYTPYPSQSIFWLDFWGYAPGWYLWFMASSTAAKTNWHFSLLSPACTQSWRRIRCTADFATKPLLILYRTFPSAPTNIFQSSLYMSSCLSHPWWKTRHLLPLSRRDFWFLDSETAICPAAHHQNQLSRPFSLFLFLRLRKIGDQKSAFRRRISTRAPALWP